MEQLHSDKKDIAWGSQIRSYVLQPYRLAKDHRTNMEIGNVDGSSGRRSRPVHRSLSDAEDGLKQFIGRRFTLFNSKYLTG